MKIAGGFKMEKPTVYFTDFRCPVGTSQLDKLKKLCIAAGIKDIDMDGKFVAIKMHFGELGNLAFLRPNYAKAVADLCIREAEKTHWNIWTVQISMDLIQLRQAVRLSLATDFAEPMK